MITVTEVIDNHPESINNGLIMSIGIRNPVARRKAIQQELVLRGIASVRELSQLLGVSSSTIRRDLESLQRDSLLKRTFGGAEVCNTRYVELAFADREKQNLEGKRAIAKMAIKLVRGLSYIDPSDAELANRLVHRAKKSVALITSDKLGASARVTAVSVSDLDLLITDTIDRQLKNRFDACGLEVTETLVTL